MANFVGPVQQSELGIERAQNQICFDYRLSQQGDRPSSSEGVPRRVSFQPARASVDSQKAGAGVGDLAATPILPSAEVRAPDVDDECNDGEPLVYTVRQQLYLFLEDPDSSLSARIFSHFVMYTIVASIACFVLETVPDLKHWSYVWDIVEPTITVIFTLEYIGRLFVCDSFPVGFYMNGRPLHQSKYNFVKSPMNVLDILAVLPFYLEVAAEELMRTVRPLRVLRSVRLIRCFRVFKLSKYSLGMTIMIESLSNSVQPLSILTFFLFIGVVLTSSLMYYAERTGCPDVQRMREVGTFRKYSDECNVSDNGRAKNGDLCCNEHGSALDFESIYRTFWWSMVTMTTVGYGDRVPRTLAGRLVGCIAMLSGIVLISLPVAIVGSKFQQAYDDLLEEDEGTNEQEVLPNIDAELDQFGHRETLNSCGTHLSSPYGLVPNHCDLGSADRCLARQGSKEKARPESLPNDAAQPIAGLRASLKAIREKPRRLSEKAKDELGLLLEMLDHIERVEKQLKISREKDARLDSSIRKEFASVSRAFNFSSG